MYGTTFGWDAIVCGNEYFLWPVACPEPAEASIGCCDIYKSCKQCIGLDFDANYHIGEL